jgi:glycosyltransferase involved in cell wall biosynthesis
MTDVEFSIIMPAFNAADHIGTVLDRIPAVLQPSIKNIWIVNDGSKDLTGAMADTLALKNGSVRPVHFDKNRGYGAALKKGLSLCKDDGCEVAVCLHADGQYPPEVIPDAIRIMREKSFDIMQGSRIASGTALSGGMPVYKFLANRALTFFENIVFGLSMTDYHSGMLFYSRRAIKNLPFDSFSDSFDFDVEVIASARAHRYKIGELPIPTHYGSEISHVHSVFYGLQVVNVMRKYLRGRYSNP